MAVEPLWTAEEMRNLGNSVYNLQELLQSWEQDNDIKISDMMINIEAMARPSASLGLISMYNKGDTGLQFEAIDASITIA